MNDAEPRRQQWVTSGLWAAGLQTSGSALTADILGYAGKVRNGPISRHILPSYGYTGPALFREGQHQCNSSHQNEADGPRPIQIEPTPRYESETKIAVNQPRQASPDNDHRGCVDDRDQHGHPEIGTHDGPGCLVSFVEISLPAESKIDRYEHQSCAMRNCHGEGPKPQLHRPDPRQCPWMTPVYKPEDTEPDNEEAGRDLYLELPFDERDQQRERKDHQ